MPRISNSKRTQILNELISYGENNEHVRSSTIAKKFEVNPITIARYKKILKDEGLIKNESNISEIFTDKEKFLEIDCVKRFKENLLLNNIDPNEHVTRLFKICRVILIRPEEFLVDLRTAQLKFLDFQNKYIELNPNVSVQNYRKTLRKFLTTNDMVIPSSAKVLSGSSEPSNNYGKVALSDEEFEKGLVFMESNGGLSFKALFAIHHEIFPRSETLVTWNPQFEFLTATVDGKSYEYAECSVYEEKQQKTYDKLILRPDILKIAKELPKNTPIMGSEKPSKIREAYALLLRNFYEELGKIDLRKSYTKGTDEWFYQNRPLYTLRHSSAVMWCRRTGFNASLVATMGWEDPDTLTNYYARMSVRNLLQQGTCWHCNPPLNDTGNKLFCSPNHCIAYYGEKI